MNTINKILKELIKGKNISTYITIFLVVIFLTLKFFNITNFVDIQSVILTVLTIILINKIQKKWILDEQTNILRDIDNHINQPNFNIIDSWSSQKVYNGISKTNSNITLVQSWFPDIPNISESLIKASAKNKINVNFFLIDPNTPYGMQRWKEVNKKIDKKNDKEANEKYKAQFNTSIENIKNRLDEIDNISFNIYTYLTLPTLKVYVIDKTEFYFGWLGLEGNSTQNVCFHISNNMNLKDVKKASDRITKHLNILKKNSTLLYEKK